LDGNYKGNLIRKYEETVVWTEGAEIGDWSVGYAWLR
jgi:hypothetical protein